MVSGSARPEFTPLGPGAFPAPMPGGGWESGAAASEAVRAEVRPGSSARLRPQRQTAAHPGWEPVDASHPRRPSPEGAFLPGLPGRPVVPSGGDRGWEGDFLQTQDQTLDPSLLALTSCAKWGKDDL